MSETRGEPIVIQPFTEVDNLPNRKATLTKKLTEAYGKYGTLANPYWRAATDKAARIELSLKCMVEPENHQVSMALEHLYEKIQKNKEEVDGYENAWNELEDDMTHISSMHFRVRKTANSSGDIRISESDALVDRFLVDQVRKVHQTLTKEKVF